MQPLAWAAARKNVFSDACVPLQRIFRFKIKLKPAELSEHLGQIRAGVWFPLQNLLDFIIAVTLLRASPTTAVSLLGS